MSREILFRGQTRRKGEYVKNVAGEPMDSNWVYGGICMGTGVFSIIYTYDPVAKRVVYTDTVTQYTGLQDKKGTKVFEGDIVKVPFNKYPYQVFFDDCFRLMIEDKYGNQIRTHQESIDRVEAEVIGNKFDHPELLEVQDEQAN